MYLIDFENIISIIDLDWIPNKIYENVKTSAVDSHN